MQRYKELTEELVKLRFSVYSHSLVDKKHIPKICEQFNEENKQKIREIDGILKKADKEIGRWTTLGGNYTKSKI